MTEEHCQTEDISESSESCEICGGSVDFVDCDITIGETGKVEQSSTRMLCMSCAKREKLYPSLWARVRSWPLRLLLWLLRPIIRRMFPREYWEARFKEIEQKK